MAYQEPNLKKPSSSLSPAPPPARPAGGPTRLQGSPPAHGDRGQTAAVPNRRQARVVRRAAAASLPPVPHHRPSPLARVIHWPESSAGPSRPPSRVIRRPKSSACLSRPVRRPESSVGPSRPPARVVRRPESSAGGLHKSSAGSSRLSARVVRRPTDGSLPLPARPAGPSH